MTCSHTRFCLHGQKALITGAAGGIGQAMAHMLAEAGASLVLSDIRKDAVEELAEHLEQAYPNAGPMYAWPVPLDNHEALENLVPKADQLCGGIDILLNNAGITRDSIGYKMTDEAWHEVIAVNLTAAFILSRAAIKSMAQRQYGRIINTASVVAVTGNIGQANYCASKAGLIGMTKALALETVTKGITINAIAPGFIATPMTAQIPETVIAKIVAKIPAQAMGKPQDIAAAALYLASREAGYVTGQTLHVNGGMVMV